MDAAMMALMTEVGGEIDKAENKFPTWPDDPFHAVGIVGEEYGELVRGIVQHTYEPHRARRADVRKEAVQLAAMSIRFLLSFDHYRFDHCARHVRPEGQWWLK